MGVCEFWRPEMKRAKGLCDGYLWVLGSGIRGLVSLSGQRVKGIWRWVSVSIWGQE